MWIMATHDLMMLWIPNPEGSWINSIVVLLLLKNHQQKLQKMYTSQKLVAGVDALPFFTMPFDTLNSVIVIYRYMCRILQNIICLSSQTLKKQAIVLMFQSGHLPPFFFPPKGCASRRLQKQGAGGRSRRQRGAYCSSLLRIYIGGEKKVELFFSIARNLWP